MKKLELTGKSFGRLIVESLHKVKNGSTFFWCKCKCGKRKSIRGSYLTLKEVYSCGCLRKENAKKMGLSMRKHGQSARKTYRVWVGIKYRCLNSKSANFDNYGGRGITICKRWLKFENFYEDMGDKPKGKQIERRDNDGNYCKENCYWANRKQQMRNRRCTLKVTWNGKKESLSKLCEDIGICYQTAYSRLKNGEKIKRVLSPEHREFFVENNPRERLITYMGKTKRIGIWAKYFGISSSSFCYRINHGWTMKEASAIPINKHNKIKSIRK